MSFNASVAQYDSTIQYEQSTLESVNFTGGFPTSKDLAPSIIFLILYLASVPVLIWRLCRASDRTAVLIRPAIFVACRIGMLIVRAIQSKTSFNLNMMIAELVMVSVGFLFLIDPVIELWRRHVATCLPHHEQPGWVRKLAILLKIGLLAAIATGVAGASKTSDAFDSQDGIDTVKHLRQISYCLSLGMVGIAIFTIVSTHLTFGLDVRKTGFNLLLAVLLLVVAVYRVAQCFSTDPHSAARSLTAFWVLMVLFEFFAYIMLLSISLPAWYPATKKEDKENRNRDRDVELAASTPKY